jgi:hypothetical protein
MGKTFKFLDTVLQVKGMMSRNGVTPPFMFYVQKKDEKDFNEWYDQASKDPNLIPIRSRDKLPKSHLRDYPDAICMVFDVIICKKEIQ